MRVSAPGKLILMGEHAVVYGRPALVAAIDLRLTARFTSSPDPGVTLDLPDLPGMCPGSGSLLHYSWGDVLAYARAARERWDEHERRPGPESFRELRGTDPAHVVKAALGEALEHLGGEPPGGLHLRIDSELPAGSGFGSSAATAVAVIAGCFAWRSAAVDAAAVERLALEAERRQHGHPSGVDGATVLRGGILWAVRLPSGGLAIEPVHPRSPLLSRLRVYHTGTPAEATGAVVAAVRQRRDADPARFERVLDRIAAATAALRVELEREDEDRERTLHLIREAQSCLADLGVVPETVQAVVREVEALGGAAKVSGAGALTGPGAGSLLVYHPEPERLLASAALRPFPDHAVHLGAPGFREEAAG